MSKTVQTVVAKLFSDQNPPEKTQDFAWWLIRRRRRPFLLLPAVRVNPRVSLALYSAQRRRAKIWRGVVTLLLKTPAAVIFQRIYLQADANSDIIRFLSEQSGVPASRLHPPAIKFGGLESHRSRLVLLVCDSANRPLKVIKVGLDEAGRATTEREADLLEKLPAKTLGCIRVTGRLATPKFSAFATDFFPGDSPENDIGMEILFHSWINPGPVVAIESLDSWRELETAATISVPAAWQVLRTALAGNKIHSTLHHGDFAPWNIRAVNSQNLQAFDWERGNLQGFPGWDWFHFIVQTSILARRHSVERVAAEVEELLQSPRFKKYAAAAGIHDLAQPLVLTYLLHHRWVVNPLDGGNQVEELYELLATRWKLTPKPQPTASHQSGNLSTPATLKPDFWGDAAEQLRSACSQLANVFWEPTLTAPSHPPLMSLLKTNWPLILFCSFWLGALAVLQLNVSHLLLLPMYAVPVLLATWKINRRWGTSFAWLAAALGPLMAAAREPSSHPIDVICWNVLMRLIILQMGVFLTDRIYGQEDFFHQLITPQYRPPANFAGNWVVIMISALGFFLISWGDIFTGPRVSFLPLYLFPAILLTLFLNLRYGAFMVLAGAFIASFDEYTSKYNADFAKAFGWNFPMRFLMLFLILLLLDRVRHENVLFPPRRQNGGK